MSNEATALELFNKIINEEDYDTIESLNRELRMVEGFPEVFNHLDIPIPKLSSKQLIELYNGMIERFNRDNEDDDFVITLSYYTFRNYLIDWLMRGTAYVGEVHAIKYIYRDGWDSLEYRDLIDVWEKLYEVWEDNNHLEDDVHELNWRDIYEENLIVENL